MSPARHQPMLAVALLVMIGLGATTTAQTVSTNHVIGWTERGATTAGELQIQDIDRCAPAKTLHQVLGTPTQFWSGGTAYDPRHESVWVSDGATIVEVRLSDGKLLCTFKAQLMDAGALVSGLAIADHKRQLIQLETRAGYAGLRSYSLDQCPPTPLRDGCSLVLQPAYYSAGLAYDEVEDLVYYTITEPGFQVPRNWLQVAENKSRCKSLCNVPLGGCVHFFGTDVMGLGYDTCNKTLYATFGQGTVPVQVGDPRKCEFKVGACCVKGLVGPYRGLAVVPGWRQFKKGTNCISKGCPNCTSLDIQLYGGAPSLGNPTFGVEVVDGPSGALGILGLGVSSCGKGWPFLCGTLWLPGSPMVLVAGQLGGAQCAASLQVALPVPVQANLCGQSVCLQWVIGCSGGSGAGITPALQFTITGS